MRTFVCCVILALSVPLMGLAQKHEPGHQREAATKAAAKSESSRSEKAESGGAAEKKPEAREVQTPHSVEIAGVKVDYTATAGTLILRNEKQEPTAEVFYIAYTKNGVGDFAHRPVTFAYNGGPGGSSSLVDFGGFGPREIVWPQPGSTTAVRPPYEMKPNPDTLLASTDLVFVDAVGTGYSRILPPKGTKKMFYGVSEDADAFTQFIQEYVTKFHRWNSPKFLLGESYGTTRNAVLANELIQKGIYLNGVIMCSTVLSFPTVEFAPGNDLPYILFLPSYTAAAWYHHRLNPEPASLPDLVKKAEAFAEGSYATALFKGSELGAAEKQSIASQLSELTGLPASLWVESNLRISLSVFRRKLMGLKDETTGRYDSRYTIEQLEPMLPYPEPGSAGASSSAMMGALTASFNDYVENHLNYDSDRPYQQLSYQVNEAWDWKYQGPRMVLEGGSRMMLNVAPALARAMTNDPGLEVMFNNGYFDMATPFFATEYSLRHTTLPKGGWQRIAFDYYHCGHMLYLNPKVLPELNANINKFITQASAK